VNEGTLLLTNTAGSATGTGNVTVYTGASMGGTGSTVSDVTVQTGAFLTPGISGVGELTIGDLVIDGAFVIDVNGTLAGQFDRLNVNGTVDLTSATLTANGTVTSPNGSIVIINNDGTGDAVLGEFSGYPDGSIVVINSRWFEIDYQGGDGNDVVLNSVNQPPVVNDQSFAVDENSSNGTVVGAIAATDVDGGLNGTLTYTLDNQSVPGAFAVDPVTGEITVANGALLNFEGTNTFTLNITVSDGGTPPLFDTAVITITLNDLNEAPVVNDNTVALNENVPNGTAVYSVGATDPDTTSPNNALVYAITGGNTGGAFAIDSSGNITVANNAAVNFETNPVFTLQVTVTDQNGTGLSDTAIITINLNDLNDQPVVNDQAFSVDENSPNATIVGTIVFSDEDTTAPNNTLTITLNSQSVPGAFAVDANGVITVANGTLLEFNDSPFTLNVTVTDGNGLFDTAVITITLNDVNEAPTANDATVNVNENLPNGTVVHTVVATDPDATSPNNSLQYSITAGNTGGAFAINATTGAITVANSSALNYETNPVFTLTVQVTDQNGLGLVDTATITINLNNLNEAPANLIIDPIAAINEGSSISLSGSFLDEDAGQTHEIDIDWGDGSPIQTINLGLAQTYSGILHNYADNGNYTVSVTVRETSGGTLSASTNTSVVVNNVAPTLSGVALNSPTINENGSVTLSGNIFDPGVNDNFVLTINWGDGTIETYPLPGGSVNFNGISHTYLDDNPTGTPSDGYTISVTLTDKDSGSDSDSVNLTVNNVAPLVDQLVLVSVGNQATLTGRITDPGTQDTFQLTIDWGDGSTPEVYNLNAAALGSQLFALTHTFTGSGTPTIILQTLDDDGGIAMNTPLGGVILPSGLNGDPNQVLPFDLTVIDAGGGDSVQLTLNLPVGTTLAGGPLGSPFTATPGNTQITMVVDSGNVSGMTVSFANGGNQAIGAQVTVVDALNIPVGLSNPVSIPVQITQAPVVPPTTPPGGETPGGGDGETPDGDGGGTPGEVPDRLQGLYNAFGHLGDTGVFFGLDVVDGGDSYQVTPFLAGVFSLQGEGDRLLAITVTDENSGLIIREQILVGPDQKFFLPLNGIDLSLLNGQINIQIEETLSTYDQLMSLVRHGKLDTRPLIDPLFQSGIAEGVMGQIVPTQAP